MLTYIEVGDLVILLSPHFRFISSIMNKITLKDLHDLNNKYPHIKEMHLSYQYDTKVNQWKFTGYRCAKCGHLFYKKLSFIETHNGSCKPPLKLANPETTVLVKTLEGVEQKVLKL